MATRISVTCPICGSKLEHDEDLQQHLLREHRPPELASQIVSYWEDKELGEDS